MTRTLDDIVAAYKTAVSRHRGPFSLAVWRPDKDAESGSRMEWVKTDDPVDDMLMYLGDPRDTVTSVDVWSHSEQQYSISGRPRDFGFPEPGFPAAEGRTEEMAAKKNIKLVQTSTPAPEPKPAKTKPTAPAKEKTARGREYEVVDGATGPDKGETAVAVWNLFKKYNPATVQEVFDRASADPKLPKPSKDTVASCASTFKKAGWLK